MDDTRRTSHPAALKCLYTNVDTFSNKKDEFYLRVFAEQPDVIGLSEICQKRKGWKITAQELELPGYNVYFNPNGRGVALFVKDHLSSCEILVLTDYDTSVWCEIRLSEQCRAIVGSMYRSPNSSVDNDSKLNQTIKMICDMNYSHVLLMGDLNYPEIEWTRLTSLASPSHSSHEFLNCIQDCYLYQHVAAPTHYRAVRRLTHSIWFLRMRRIWFMTLNLAHPLVGRIILSSHGTIFVILSDLHARVKLLSTDITIELISRR